MRMGNDGDVESRRHSADVGVVAVDGDMAVFVCDRMRTISSRAGDHQCRIDHPGKSNGHKWCLSVRSDLRLYSTSTDCCNDDW